MKISMTLLFSIFLAVTGCGQKRDIRYEHHPDEKALAKYSQATFAAGCFWHEEAMFESIRGVKEAISGYAGERSANPSYESIERGNTGYAETVNVYYDSSNIDFPTLLKIYFSGQNATQANGQGPDLGSQYRSIVFYRNITEKEIIENI
jgi:peptide-methionine (S)-S-oxide reductase